MILEGKTDEISLEYDGVVGGGAQFWQRCDCRDSLSLGCSARPGRDWSVGAGAKHCPAARGKGKTERGFPLQPMGKQVGIS